MVTPSKPEHHPSYRHRKKPSRIRSQTFLSASSGTGSTGRSTGSSSRSFKNICDFLIAGLAQPTPQFSPLSRNPASGTSTSQGDDVINKRAVNAHPTVARCRSSSLHANSKTGVKATTLPRSRTRSRPFPSPPPPSSVNDQVPPIPVLPVNRTNIWPVIKAENKEETCKSINKCDEKIKTAVCHTGTKTISEPIIRESSYLSDWMEWNNEIVTLAYLTQEHYPTAYAI
ncbi:hypothetical protein BY996DRAFT_825310 [Phakopsora pachyrhizi]|nr:hypothetical protein BY996DRAFT_825310 [Phakopsora pachyrhizi]